MELGVVAYTVAHAGVQSRDELERLRHLLLHPQAHLQAELLPQLGDRRFALLGHQDEDREEDRLERHDHRQQAERKRVERGHRKDTAVPSDPGAEPEHVEHQEGRGARDVVQPVGESLELRAVRRMLRLDRSDREVGDRATLAPLLRLVIARGQPVRWVVTHRLRASEKCAPHEAVTDVTRDSPDTTLPKWNSTWAVSYVEMRWC